MHDREPSSSAFIALAGDIGVADLALHFGCPHDEVVLLCDGEPAVEAGRARERAAPCYPPEGGSRTPPCSDAATVQTAPTIAVSKLRAQGGP